MAKQKDASFSNWSRNFFNTLFLLIFDETLLLAKRLFFLQMICFRFYKTL